MSFPLGETLPLFSGVNKPNNPATSPVQGRFKLDGVEYQLATNNGLGRRGLRILTARHGFYVYPRSKCVPKNGVHGKKTGSFYSTAPFWLILGYTTSS